METATVRMRRGKPFLVTKLKTRAGLDQMVEFIERKGLLADATIA